jgi:hypothetical protein
LAQRNANKIIASTSCPRFYTGIEAVSNSPATRSKNPRNIRLVNSAFGVVEQFFTADQTGRMLALDVAASGRHVRLLRERSRPVAS